MGKSYFLNIESSKVAKWSIETHTRLIREDKQEQIPLNLLIGLKGIKYKNRIS